MKTTLAILAWLVAGVAVAQQPYYYPPAYGYWSKAEAMQQQQFENQLRWRQQQKAEWDYWFPDPIEFARRATELRLLKRQERALQLDNQRRESAVPSPFTPIPNPFQ